jgi:hypothetical protein
MSEINTTKVTEKMVVSCRNVIGGCASTSQTTRAALAATVGISVTALLLGIGIGGAAQPDPTATAEYATLEDILADTEKRAAQAEEQLETAQQDAAAAQTQYDRLAAEVKDLEARQATWRRARRLSPQPSRGPMPTALPTAYGSSAWTMTRGDMKLSTPATVAAALPNRIW